jgi:hypothetical protein
MKLALLVIGNLGKTGEISLNSVMKLAPERVCVLTNNSGKNWLNTLDWLVNESICFHTFKQSRSSSSTNVLSFTDYSNYRTTNFDLLTSLKWHLILDVMKKHKETKRVLYTDLDIYWHTKLSEEIFLDQSCDVWVQYTPEQIRTQWFCTGIMSWPNSSNSMLALEKLIDFQNLSFESEIPANDEIIFNNCYENLEIKIKKLPVKKYLVGKEFNKVFIAPHFFFPNLTCFHANYFVGNSLKAEILKVISVRLSSKYKWITFVPFVIGLNLQDFFLRIRKRSVK